MAPFWFEMAVEECGLFGLFGLFGADRISPDSQLVLENDPISQGKKQSGAKWGKYRGAASFGEVAGGWPIAYFELTGGADGRLTQRYFHSIYTAVIAGKDDGEDDG